MNNTSLLINRVTIRAGFKVVYDEEFHKGLNVIRGYNGTGKSTIMELISYGLGGDIKKHAWKREALDCTQIQIALELNSKPYVFKRAIEEEGSKPLIEIFEGSIANSMEKGAKWTSYKNKKSETRKSYSMQIFELLGLQQHNTADSESLTLHQLLRLLYIDQDTPASKIFRTEPFTYDKESMRRAIGEYMFGFDNLEAHAIRQKLYSYNKKFDKLNDELRAVYRVLGQTNIKASPLEIDEEIKGLQIELYGLEKQRLLKKRDESNYENRETAEEATQIQIQIQQQVIQISELESEFSSTSYEISESKDFVDTLGYRKQALQKANVTEKAINQLGFKYCPSCMTEIAVTDNDEACCLCKSEGKANVINETYIQALNELDFQLIETNQMLESQLSYKAKLEASIKNHKETLNHLRIKLNEINSYTSDYEVELTKLANQKGFIHAQIANLKERQTLASELEEKRKLKANYQNKILGLESQLDNLEMARKKRVKSVKRKISKKVIEILSYDGGVEPAFDDAKKFDFDFATDSFRLDDRANFSASSNVILKNAFHLATLLVAIKDKDFRLPCFSMFDNIEDKGMREDRSQRFQRVIVDLTKEQKSRFQIIMTTSMVDPSINNERYGVGPYYNKGQHTLNL